ncbi:MAG TPA: hypothetical protein VG498_01880, partial [Terriglobales bacterium]|nr:hypothetical protein [Terriglobales bacterium]
MADTIADMMEAYAADAVRLAPDFNVQLDYSEASLERLEGILERVAAENTQIAPPGSQVSKDPEQAQIDATSRIWGGYFGETIR